MKLAIFLVIFILVFGLVGYYVFTRTLQVFSGVFVHSKLFLILYVIIMSSFLFGKIIEFFSVGFFSELIIKIGSVGLSFFLYSLSFIVFFDIVRLVNHFIPFYPSFVSLNYSKTKLIIGIISLISISVIFVYGYINAGNCKIKNIDININKDNSELDLLNIVAISDIHLGTNVNKSRVKKLVYKINQLNPDVVIIAGDIIDDNINVVKYYKLVEYFNGIKSKYGVYSCLGNHEYISRAYKNLEYFENNGIKVLKDTAVNIDNKFYIIGRDDIEGKNITGVERKSLKELTANIDFNLPVILLDHQPFNLEKTSEYDIDLQFSGHTHNGQIWPFNYITGLIFEEDWGYLKKKNTHYYVSSGFGTAVVPIKVGNYSEIVNIKLKIVSK